MLALFTYELTKAPEGECYAKVPLGYNFSTTPTLLPWGSPISAKNTSKDIGTDWEPIPSKHSSVAMEVRGFLLLSVTKFCIFLL